MTGISGWTRTVTMAAALLLSATVASPQSATHEHPTAPDDRAHGEPAQPLHGARSMATMHKDMMRLVSEDARLAALVADINMFTGELKVDAMARVLTLLVERHSMLREHMMEMHARMMPGVMGAIADAPAGGAPDAGVTADSEPGEMCSPTTY